MRYTIIGGTNGVGKSTIYSLLCDEVWIYDNTLSYNLVARGEDGIIKILDKNIHPNILPYIEQTRTEPKP